MTAALEPEALARDAAGHPWSPRYGDRYASRAGALGQARHVFLGGNGLPLAWAGRRQFNILETGFGLGNNFLATWQAWRADARRPERLHYVSVELHPLRAQDLLQATSDDVEDASLATLRAQLADAWPLPLPGLHRLEFEDGAVVLTLALGDARFVVPELVLGADACFLDGFAPDRNPQMWEPAMLKALARLARPGATLATYTSAGAVRAALDACGFAVQRQDGFGGKRDMLAGSYAPRWKMRRREPPAAYDGERRAIVVGAGLAGGACVAALARRGWHVTLLERGATGCAGASAMPAGLLYPLLSADDNLASRLSRAGYLQALQALARLGPAARDTVWTPCGVFHQPADSAELAALQARLRADATPAAYACAQTASAAAARLGLAPRRDGIWFEGGVAVDGARWCSAMAGLASQAHYGVDIVGVDAQEAGWMVRDSQGRQHEAPILILATAHALPGLLDARHLPLQALGGRLSLLAQPALHDLRAGVSGDGYCIPALLGAAAIGASYEVDPGAIDQDLNAAAATAAHAGNIERLRLLFATAPPARIGGEFAAQRCVSHDRLPVAGPVADEQAVLQGVAGLAGAQLEELPRRKGLFCLAGLGSRGLSLAPLLGELLAAQINGEPQPLERALGAAVDPARFLLRHVRTRANAPAVAQ